jgi:hypothetical protein
VTESILGPWSGAIEVINCNNQWRNEIDLRRVEAPVGRS